MLLLDSAHRVVGIDDVAVGCANSLAVHPQEVFKAAILANASAVIATPNHSSGEVAHLTDDILTPVK